MAQNLNKVPSGAEVWVEHETGKHYLVYFTTGSNPAPLLWHIPGPSDLDSLFGEGQPVQIDKRVTTDQLTQMGAQEVGTSDDVQNTSEAPIRRFTENFQQHARIKPWLRDPEMLRLATEALYEGRATTPAERKNTTWWRTHSDAEREWLELLHGDPSTAAQQKQDNRLRIENLLVQGGYQNPDPALVNAIADNVTTGRWSQTYAQDQVQKVIDPFAPGRLDQELQPFVSEDPEPKTVAQTERARQIMTDWLGPYANLDAVDHWASRLRNDPDAEEELVQELRSQKKALFPEYGEDARWVDIAGPWKNFVKQQWGQEVTDDDPILHDVIQLNDASEAGDLLRRKGLERGVDRVVDSALNTFASELQGAL